MGVTRGRFGLNGSLALAGKSRGGVEPAGPMEFVRAVAWTKSWPRCDHDGQIDAAKSSWEAAARATRPLLARQTRQNRSI